MEPEVRINAVEDNFLAKEEEGKSNSRKILLIISLITVLLLLSLVIFLLISSSSSSSSPSSKNETTNQDTLICTFNIDNITKETQILSEEFQKDSSFDMYIDDVKITPYQKKYKFSTLGEHKIKISLLENAIFV